VDVSLAGAIRSVNTIFNSVWHDESNRDQRVRRLAMAAGWQAWKRIVRMPLTVSLFNGTRFRAYPDCFSSSSVFYARVPNSQHIGFLRHHVQGGTFLDVGANVGLVSVLLADRVQHALLFEPNPAAAARARENIGLNGLKFEVHEIALSDRSGTVAFENAGGVSTVNRTVEDFSTAAPTITVPRFSYDEFISGHAELPAPVSAVKIDVEGHENSVLRGMRGLLMSVRPRLVMFEYLRRTNIQETFEIFSAAQYRVMELAQEGKPVWANADVRPLQDLFACPEELSTLYLK